MGDASRLKQLLLHDDPEWRRQGLELARALGGEAVDGLFGWLQRGPWLVPVDRPLTVELLAALASSPEHARRREAIRELPPVPCDDPELFAMVAQGFPTARLRIVWMGELAALEFLSEIAVRRLWLACPAWKGGALDAPVGLTSLSLVGPGTLPRIDNALDLRDLELPEAHLVPSLEPLAPRLERLHLTNVNPHVHEPPNGPRVLPRLRDLRATSLPADLRTGRPLERLHLLQAVGRDPLEHPAVGSDTRLRVDEWYRPDPSMRGDPRPVWVGPSTTAADWEKLLPTFPRLEVVELSHRYSERTVLQMPPGALPAPRTLWEPEHHRPYLGAEAHTRAVRAWADRGRDSRLRCTRPTDRIISAIKAVRAFARTSLRDAKIFVEAAHADALVALTFAEAVEHQALLHLAGIGTEIERRR